MAFDHEGDHPSRWATIRLAHADAPTLIEPKPSRNGLKLGQALPLRFLSYVCGSGNRITDFGRVGCEPQQEKTVLKPGFGLGFCVPY